MSKVLEKGSKIVLALMVLAFLVFWDTSSPATIIDFEDLYPGHPAYGSFPSSYAGFNWSSSSYWITKDQIIGSGYDYGTIGLVSGFTGYAQDISISTSSSFNFVSAYITAAWLTSLDVMVEGWKGGSMIYSQTITTHDDKPYQFLFNFMGIDTLWFRPLGSSDEKHIVIDNLEVSAVPLPSSLLLLGSGLAGLAAWRRLRV